ncbi:hypothetical protein CSHISOI_08918 [Colletotrichum shisoi]|uniref:Uncharacterized protein n=1 Tax=Colletotrichum shisoi TaxID=2078593 RepID=A0A5Q4BHX2_9PEZI|nr:hypothetical protein CSHISOI_08918 [Colletotrichum shisoi]
MADSKPPPPHRFQLTFEPTWLQQQRQQHALARRCHEGIHCPRQTFRQTFCRKAHISHNCSLAIVDPLLTTTPSYHRLSEEREEDEEENSPSLGGKTDGDNSPWHLRWPAINLRDDPLDSDEQEASEGRLARDLMRSRTAVRVWRLVSMALAAALTVSCLLLVSRHDDSHCRADYPQPGEGTDNVLKWMKEAEVADGHFWCGSTIAEAKHRGCTFDKLHNRWMSPVCEPDFEPAKKAVFEALGGGGGGGGGGSVGSVGGNGDNGAVPEFRFYRDDEGKPGARISDEDLDELEVLTPAWTTVGHHMTHCMYLLLQAAAALNLGTKADMVVHAWEHAKHCATVILNETRRSPAWDDVASFGHSQSGVCW